MRRFSIAPSIPSRRLWSYLKPKLLSAEKSSSIEDRYPCKDDEVDYWYSKYREQLFEVYKRTPYHRVLGVNVISKKVFVHSIVRCPRPFRNDFFQFLSANKLLVEDFPKMFLLNPPQYLNLGYYICTGTIRIFDGPWVTAFSDGSFSPVSGVSGVNGVAGVGFAIFKNRKLAGIHSSYVGVVKSPLHAECLGIISMLEAVIESNDKEIRKKEQAKIVTHMHIMIDSKNLGDYVFGTGFTECYISDPAQRDLVWKIISLLQHFDHYKITVIPQAGNALADALAKMGLQTPGPAVTKRNPSSSNLGRHTPSQAKKNHDTSSEAKKESNPICEHFQLNFELLKDEIDVGLEALPIRNDEQGELDDLVRFVLDEKPFFVMTKADISNLEKYWGQEDTNKSGGLPSRLHLTLGLHKTNDEFLRSRGDGQDRMGSSPGRMMR